MANLIFANRFTPGNIHAMNRSILIIDDDEDDNFFLCEAIKQIDNSINCDTFVNAIQALDFLTNTNGNTILPDYIFLDLNLPKLSGRECLIRLKKTTRIKDIPVIIYSTSRREEEKEEVKKKGAAYFLTKPSKLSILVDEINYIFSTL